MQTIPALAAAVLSPKAAHKQSSLFCAPSPRRQLCSEFISNRARVTQFFLCTQVLARLFFTMFSFSFSVSCIGGWTDCHGFSACVEISPGRSFDVFSSVSLSDLFIVCFFCVLCVLVFDLLLGEVDGCCLLFVVCYLLLFLVCWGGLFSCGLGLW